MTSPPRFLRWLLPLLLVVVWLGGTAVTGPFAGKLEEVSTNDQAAFLPKNAESTKVLEAEKAFESEAKLPAIVVWTADDGPMTKAQRDSVGQTLRAMEADSDAVQGVLPARPSQDGEALLAQVDLAPDLGEELEEVVEHLTKQANEVAGTTAQVGGPAAERVDLTSTFAGIDGLLLGVALCVVLLILLLVYRSVLLPLLIIFVALSALTLACAVVYQLADRDMVRVDGQVQGILFILVIGAATDYALLLTARCREELAAGADRFTAAKAALRQSAGAITASSATVALGLLALTLSDLTNTAALGPVGAIGITCALISVLTFLPALVALVGRAAYWPARTAARTDKRKGHAAVKRGLWHRVAGLVDRHPRRTWAGALVALLACAAFVPTLTARGAPLDELFINDAPSVTTQQTIGEHFPAGIGAPAVVIAAEDDGDQIVRAATETDGVSGAAYAGGAPGDGPRVVDGKVRVDVVLADAPDTREAERTVRELRTAVHAAADSEALVGGYTAQLWDTQQAAEDDRFVIVPVVLVIIMVILMALLRSAWLSLLLVATVVVNYLAVLGISALVFERLLGFSGIDPSIPLYGFVFLVALGVDYNIFLMTRVREETVLHGTREGVRRGLIATGGIITSAGVVLAATFGTLIVIPLSFLVHIAFIVAFGVLLDTFVVRSLLVPALVRDIGPSVWWPGIRASRATPPGPPPPGSTPPGPSPETLRLRVRS